MLDSSLEMSSSVSEAEFKKGSWPASCCLLQIGGGGGCELGLMGAATPPRNGLGSFGGGLGVIRCCSFRERSDAGESESRLLALAWPLFKGLVVARGLQDGRALGGLNEYFAYVSTRDED